jgi:uncharacterized membrane protein YeaQ/YmgE (transglycosylase-associated protein family)
MTLTLPGLILLIVIAAICGAVGRALGGGVRGGLMVSTAIGFIGALLGPWVARQFHLAEPFILRVGGYSFPILWSIIGGALFVAFLHLLAGPRRIWS